jgi:hypothetical protein
VRAAAALAAVALGACTWLPKPPEPKPVNFYSAAPRDLDNVQRVLVLPFACAAGVTADTMPLREAFLVELAKIQRLELVPLPDGAEEDRPLYESLVRGRISTEALVELSERYQLDGVLLGTVTAYRPYLPVHLGLRVQLVSVHSGSTVWAAEGLYDANDAATIEDLRHYQLSFAAAEASFHGVEINLISPRKFAAYVAHRLVATWRER